MKILILISMLSINCFGHGDHSIPGVIPPAPNGGTLGEASHKHSGSHKHDHKEASEKEIFFEGIYKNNSLEISFLELEPKESKHFLVHDFGEMSELKLIIKDPRKGKVINRESKVENNKLQVDLKGIRARRLVFELSGVFKGAKYSAKVQVERK